MAQNYPKLIVLSGSEEGKELTLSDLQTVKIGRSDENELMLYDTSVSRRHATLIKRGTQWFLRDENSRNGSYINENKISAETDSGLSNMDVIRLGIYDVRYVEKEISDDEIKKSAVYKKEDTLSPANNASVNTQESIQDADDSEGTESDGSFLDTDKDELQDIKGKDYSEELSGPKMGKSLLIFIVIAALFCLIGFGIHFMYGNLKQDSKKQNIQKEKVLTNKDQELPTKEDKEDIAKDQKSTEVIKDESQDNDKDKTQEKVEESQKEFSALPIDQNKKDASPDEIKSVRDFSVFLDIKTEPLPATIFFGEERLGNSPLKQNISVKPNKTYTLYADFELRDINDIYRKKVEFKVKPETDVVELAVDAEIGILKILKLPPKIDFYLEGYYDYDKLKANPVKLTDIVYGKPIYLPYGKYIVELREKTKISGSDLPVTEIRYQREYTISKDSRVLTLSVTDKDLQFFPAVIKSNPSNAQVYFDDKKMGDTPYKGLLPLGKHQLKVVKDGFFASVIDVDMRMNSVYETTVELKTSKMGELINKAKEQLRNDFANEAINTLVEALKFGGSSVEKAEVYFMLGNIYLSQKNYEQAKPYFEKAKSEKAFFHQGTLGLAQVYHGLKQNTQALRTVIESLVNITNETPIAIRSEANSVFKLISPVNSVLYIYTEPSGANVFVNDERLQQQTPLILSDLGLGAYKLQFEKNGFETYKTKQTLKIGEFVIVKVKLEPENL